VWWWCGGEEAVAGFRECTAVQVHVPAVAETGRSSCAAKRWLLHCGQGWWNTQQIRAVHPDPASVYHSCG
jgi:hypothetical protein